MTGNHVFRLDIGCGRKKREGFLGIDVCPASFADVLADPERGLPFKENVISEVWMHHVFEHLGNPVAVMEEIWRVCRDGAKVEIRGPHFSTPYLVWGDPTHKRGLSLGTFEYFNGTWYGARVKFEVERCILKKGNTSFKDAGWRFWYWPFVLPNRIIEFLVNRSEVWIHRYERLASRIVAFEEIRVILSVCKSR